MAPADRAALARRMFEHVLSTALAVPSRGPVYVISRSSDILAHAEALGAMALAEQAYGLNPALEQASGALGGDEPVLTLSADLPLLTLADLAAILGQTADVACATDEPGQGTNALFLRRPGLIRYSYGPGSLAAHRAAAAACGLSFSEIRRPGLARDIDVPDDLARIGPDWPAVGTRKTASPAKDIP